MQEKIVGENVAGRTRKEKNEDSFGTIVVETNRILVNLNFAVKQDYHVTVIFLVDCNN